MMHFRRKKKGGKNIPAIRNNKAREEDYKSRVFDELIRLDLIRIKYELRIINDYRPLAVRISLEMQEKNCKRPCYDIGAEFLKETCSGLQITLLIPLYPNSAPKKTPLQISFPISTMKVVLKYQGFQLSKRKFSIIDSKN